MSGERDALVYLTDGRMDANTRGAEQKSGFHEACFRIALRVLVTFR